MDFMSLLNQWPNSVFHLEEVDTNSFETEESRDRLSKRKLTLMDDDENDIVNEWTNSVFHLEQVDTDSFETEELKDRSSERKLNLFDDDEEDIVLVNTLAKEYIEPMEIDILDNLPNVYYYSGDASLDILELKAFPTLSVVNLNSVENSHNLPAIDILKNRNSPASTKYSSLNQRQANDISSETNLFQVVPHVDSPDAQVKDENPPNSVNTSSQKKTSKRGRKKGYRAKIYHLWEFLADLLKNKEPCVEWYNEEQLIFLIKDTKQLAKLWSKVKNNPKMEYRSMARGIRHCRDKGEFVTIPDDVDCPRKKCYQFGKQVLLRLGKTG